MRVTDQPLQTFAAILGAAPQVQPSKIIPALGPVMGFWLDLTVSLVGATPANVSNTIDRVIASLEVDKGDGEAVLIAAGTDLSVLNDLLQPHGVRQAPPTITTGGGGAGTAEWHFFFPWTIASDDVSNAQFKVTFDSLTSLQNAGLVSAGTPTVTLGVRVAFAVGQEQPTLLSKIVSPPHAAGDNDLQAFLPNGFQVEGLCVVIAADADYGWTVLQTGGALLVAQGPRNDLIDADTMLMQSGHLAGEFIYRLPVFVVDSTTVYNLNLAIDSAIRLYSLATVPQKRK